MEMRIWEWEKANKKVMLRMEDGEKGRKGRQFRDESYVRMLPVVGMNTFEINSSSYTHIKICGLKICDG